MADQRMEHEPWPMRAGLLLGLGMLCGLIVDQLIQGESGDNWSVTDNVARLSLASFVAISGVLFAFTLERARWKWSLAFATSAGAVLGLIFYSNGTPDGRSADDFWRVVAALLSVAIAAPLFQTVRDQGARKLPYGPVHAHAWANVVLWCASWAFVLVTWLLALLLGELFQLIGIRLLRDLLDKSWADWMLVGGALGAAVGLLRDRDRIVGLLQRVVTNVLSVLAPVLAVGLILFVLALPFTGLDALWDQTRATTPILLACVIGAFVLINAVIGTAPEEEAEGRVLRWSAMGLGAVMLPLAVVAAISTGLRVDQHGFTPERFWAIVFIAIVLACACLYLYALVRGRLGWAARLRPINIRLAIGICVVALVLATPLANFGALSTSSQLARLDSGQVSPQDFDWRALRFDFGPSGVAALQRLKTDAADPAVRRLASAAAAAERRWDIASPEEERLRAEAARNLRVLPAGTPLPDALRSILLRDHSCAANQLCLVLVQPDRAVLVSAAACPPAASGRPAMVGALCGNPRTRAYYLNGTDWLADPRPAPSAAEEQARQARIDAGFGRGAVEVREVPRRQLFIGGEPVGEPFE